MKADGDFNNLKCLVNTKHDSVVPEYEILYEMTYSGIGMPWRFNYYYRKKLSASLLYRIIAMFCGVYFILTNQYIFLPQIISFFGPYLLYFVLFKGIYLSLIYIYIKIGSSKCRKTHNNGAFNNKNQEIKYKRISTMKTFTACWRRRIILHNWW